MPAAVAATIAAMIGIKREAPGGIGSRILTNDRRHPECGSRMGGSGPALGGACGGRGAAGGVVPRRRSIYGLPLSTSLATLWTNVFEWTPENRSAPGPSAVTGTIRPV